MCNQMYSAIPIKSLFLNHLRACIYVACRQATAKNSDTSLVCSCSHRQIKLRSTLSQAEWILEVAVYLHYGPS